MRSFGHYCSPVGIDLHEARISLGTTLTKEKKSETRAKKKPHEILRSTISLLFLRRYADNNLSVFASAI